MIRNCYYISEKKYIMNQLERKSIQVDDIDISDYAHVCATAEYIADLLDKNKLLHRSCDEAVNAKIAERKKPFVFLTLDNVKYCFLSFDAVVQAVSEYGTSERKTAFITMISGKFTEEYSDYTKKLIQKKKYFGRTHFHPSEMHVLGKISWDENKAYIQPMIIY